MIKYPNGKSPVSKAPPTKRRLQNAANRGMGLEGDINLSNEYYKNTNRALITKRPTPVNVVKVDYQRGARITDAYFEKQSTTDYNGVYKGKYLDFEAKSTTSKTSFPLHNISTHQIEHLNRVQAQGGICFFIVEFSVLNRDYLIDARVIIDFYNHETRKSIPLEIFETKGLALTLSFSPRINYLDAVDQLYHL